MSIEDLAALLQAAKGDPDRLDALFNAMSDQQVEEMYAAMTDELAAKGVATVGLLSHWHTVRRPLGTR
jgi:hypothetical protein